MTDREQFQIEEDGVYEDGVGGRFQFRKGHVINETMKKTLKKVGPWPNDQNIDVAEARAAEAPSNKAAPKAESK